MGVEIHPSINVSHSTNDSYQSKQDFRYSRNKLAWKQGEGVK